MPYIHKIIEAGNTQEHRKYYNGRYKAKIKNSPAQKETPQNQKDYQDRKAEDDVRRLIDNNFYFEDYWVTLCYPAWSRPSVQQVKKDIDSFLNKLRRRYKKNNAVLKYVYTVGRGDRGAVHFHFVLNANISQSEISEIWWSVAGNEKNPYPRVNFRILDKSGYYGKIAAYLIKNSKETFWSEERIFGKRYCTSTTLKRPEPEIHVVSANTWREEPRPPKGYYLLKDSLYSGIDKENGYPYQKYIFVRINSIDIRFESEKRKKSSKKKPRNKLKLKSNIKPKRHNRITSTYEDKKEKRKRVKSGG